MALSRAEQLELEQLEKELGVKPKASLGLTPMEEAEMAQLEKEVGANVQPQASPQVPGTFMSRLKGLFTPEGRAEVKVQGDMAYQPIQEQMIQDNERNTRATLNALPAAGSMAGGVIGAPLGPYGMLKGGMLGAAGGKALENLGEGLLGDEKTTEQLYLDPVKEGLLEGTFQGVGAGVGAIARGGANLTKRFIGDPVVNVMSRLRQTPKPNAEEIVAAAERLGTKPTRGMLSDDPFIGNIESGIAQSGTVAGTEVADQFRKTGKVMTERAENIFKPVLTGQNKNQMASAARESIQSGLKSKLSPAVAVYEEIEKKAPMIAIEAKSTRRIARNIENLPYAKIEGSSEAALSRQVNANLAKIETLDELRNLKSYVGSIARDKNAPYTMRSTAGEIADKLSRLEQNSITRSVIETTKSGRISNALGRAMVKDLKAANKLYATTSQEIKALSDLAGIKGVKNYADFERKLSELPDEKLLNKLFQPNNEKLLLSLQNQFPQGFDQLRKAKLYEIYSKSITKGEVSLPKLLSTANQLQPQVRKLIFGQDADLVLKDLNTLYNALPKRVGPSGTPEGLAFIDELQNIPITPTSWLKEYKANISKRILENPEAFKRFKFESPEFKAIQKQGLPKAQLLVPLGARAMGGGQDE